MKYLKKYQDYGKINEAVDAAKLQISIQLIGYAVGEKYKKGITGACTFLYDGKPLNTAPMNFTFLDSEDRFIYSTNESFNIATGSSIHGPFKMGILKKNIGADGKAVIGNYGTEQNTWVLNLNKNGTAWMAQGIIVPGGANPVTIKPIELDLGNFFAPNVDVIDETKKTELNDMLKPFETYFTENKGALRAPGATDKYTFTFVGGASQVATTYQGGNQALAQARANNLKNYVITLYKTSNPDLSRFISQVATVTTVMGKTPYVKGTDNPQDPKFLAEQFVKLSLKVK